METEILLPDQVFPLFVHNNSHFIHDRDTSIRHRRFKITEASAHSNDSRTVDRVNNLFKFFLRSRFGCHSPWILHSVRSVLCCNVLRSVVTCLRGNTSSNTNNTDGFSALSQLVFHLCSYCVHQVTGYLSLFTCPRYISIVTRISSCNLRASK